MNQTNLSWSTEEHEVAGAAGSTDLKGDTSVADDSSLFPASFKCSIRWRASSQVSRTSWAGSKSKLFFNIGRLLSEPIAPRASAAYEVITKSIILLKEERNSGMQRKEQWNKIRKKGVPHGEQWDAKKDHLELTPEQE